MPEVIEQPKPKEQSKRLSSMQKRILEILTGYPESTAQEIATTYFNRHVKYKTKEYSSVHRSLRSLAKKNLVETVGGQIKWKRKTQ
jgi:DNA-binding MarR family transcriptional regulator